MFREAGCVLCSLREMFKDSPKALRFKCQMIVPGRSTTEQIFNLRIICEKYLQHQQDLYHVFIDFKKAFDRVWHAALWTIMRQYNIGNNLIHVIQRLYERATIAVFINGNIGD